MADVADCIAKLSAAGRITGKVADEALEFYKRSKAEYSREMGPASADAAAALEATKFSLGVAGIKPADDARVNVNIEMKAGYVIDLSEPGQPATRIVGGEAKVIDASSTRPNSVVKLGKR
jgi:hypothetical protein